MTHFTIGRRAMLAGGAALFAPRLARAQGQTLTYVGWSHDEAASKPVLTEAFDRFRAANAGIRLNTIGFPWAQMQQNLPQRDVQRLQEEQQLQQSHGPRMA